MLPCPRHILVVEDDACLRGLFIEVLSAQSDLLVDGAASIAEAEALLASPDAHYEAILLDRGLPDGDGGELCLKLRRNGLQTRVLMLSGTVGGQDAAGGFACGADDYLHKPVRIVELVVRLRAQLH
jgi:DNA-binding response OmpR family regulator